MGFRSYFTESVLQRKGYLAGDDTSRLDDLHEAFNNKDVDAILCVRGGYGSSRIVDKIDYLLIQKNPKIFIGYSDITVLLNAIWQRTGLITFHGVVGTSSFSDYTKEKFNKLFLSQYSDIGYINSIENTLEIINKGKAKGRLVGGNLVMVNSLLGTPYEIDFTDKIVFLEDVAEAPYKIDRMLTQLLLAGGIKKAAGIILGQFNGCDIDNKEITPENSLSLSDVFYNRLISLNIPIIKNFSFGHVKNQAIFPVGIKVEIATDKKGIMLLESVLEN